MLNQTPLPETRIPRWPQPQGFEPVAPLPRPARFPGGPGLYAWEHSGPGAKERLVRRLLAGLPGFETIDPCLPLILETTALGQPRLFLGGKPGSAVSFCQADGRQWAALAPTGQVGVDVALPAEFEASYPWSRAFHVSELIWARRLTGGDVPRAAALLWALKEAAVKALGVGFNLLDPLTVVVVNPEPWQGWIRVAIKAGQDRLPGWARPTARGWLALARYD